MTVDELIEKLTEFRDKHDCGDHRVVSVSGPGLYNDAFGPYLSIEDGKVRLNIS